MPFLVIPAVLGSAVTLLLVNVFPARGRVTCSRWSGSSLRRGWWLSSGSCGRSGS